VRVRPFLASDASSSRGVGGAPQAVLEDADAAFDDDCSYAASEGDATPAAAAAVSGGTPAITCAADGTSLDIVPAPPRGTKEVIAKRDTAPLRFSFDTVFGPRAGQEDVFLEVTHLVQSALDGYNVCLFSYGQTGSGKTHSMIGSPADPGIIPRSVGQVRRRTSVRAG
jgi:hypothetical protein